LRPVRATWVLLLTAVPPAVAAEDAAPPPRAEAPEHDALGFPLTVNGQVLTLADVLRLLGANPDSLPALGPLREQQLRNLRDLVLRKKLVERVGEIFSIKVAEKEVNDILLRHAEARGGEARFYEWLGQQGFTLAAYQEQVQHGLLEGRIQELLARGRGRDGKVLAYDTGWRPDELDAAFAREAKRPEGGVRARYLEFTVDLSRSERMAVISESMAKEHGPGWTEEEIARRVGARLAEVRAALDAGKSFRETAREHGADLSQETRWVDVPKEPSDDPLRAFLQRARVGTRSRPIPTPGGGWRIVRLLERKVEKAPSLEDTDLVLTLAERIRRGRKDQAYARMLLAALDRSYIRPVRVQEELRTSILADLDQARQALAALGLR